MIWKTLLATLSCTLLLSLSSFSDDNASRFVPLMTDKNGKSAHDMYAKRIETIFQVLDCSSDQLLLKTAQEVAAIWNSETPVKIILKQDAERCSGGTFGNIRSEIYWDQTSISSRPNTGEYHFNYTDTRDIIEEDIAVNLGLVVSQSASLNTSTTIVLYNALMQGFGNALGLGNAYEQYPGECYWSVMLANCTRGRLPPQEADLAAIEKIYALKPPSPLQPKDFDINHNGLVDQEEFNRAIDLWVIGSISDDLILDLYRLFISQTKIPFVETNAVIEASVRIFNLNGKVVMRQECASYHKTSLQRLLTQHAFPSGVYIALVRDCQTGRTALKWVDTIALGNLRRIIR
ncbi:hypothetical protein HY229_00340 [Candidatus Acetothermia bacterium]|nr:hypothetical protein [Candidatus Acetothermia bacterium]MBI3642545.1 hypothetical protein [Candidatus Acetothermia bacterium]